MGRKTRVCRTDKKIRGAVRGQ
ncbi:TPA_asm: UL20.4 dORF 1 [Human alphaherpesvirus 1]|nr:TPA_asm: UL20.4 dORF 1 [Human alphaherpesvirus 1]